jgi:hypothetical protein
LPLVDAAGRPHDFNRKVGTLGLADVAEHVALVGLDAARVLFALERPRAVTRKLELVLRAPRFHQATDIELELLVLAGWRRDFEKPFEERQAWSGNLSPHFEHALVVGPSGATQDDDLVVDRSVVVIGESPGQHGLRVAEF